MKLNAADIDRVAREYDEMMGWLDGVVEDSAKQLLGDSADEALARRFGWTVARWGNISGIAGRSDGPRPLRQFEVMGQLLWEKRDEIAGVTEDGVVDLWYEIATDGRFARKEWSWASKVLHFLRPDMVPAYDKNVRKVLGTFGAHLALEPSGDDHRRAFEVVHGFAQSFLSKSHSDPPSLRDLDKYLWLEGARLLGGQ